MASWLATLARNLVRAMPTVIGRPTRSRTCRAQLRGDLAPACPDTRRSPETSRNASSTLSGSTMGVVSWKTSNTASLAFEYADIRGGTTMACGHSARAWRPPIAVRTP